MIHDWVRLAPWLSSIPARQTRSRSTSRGFRLRRIPRTSGSTGGRSSTAAASTAPRACCAWAPIPGPTERIPGRCLVGNAGQRVQGFLTKLGLTRSYVCVNAWAYAVHPSQAAEQQHLDEPDSSPGATSSTTASPARSCRRSSRSARWRSAAVELWDSRPGRADPHARAASLQPRPRQAPERLARGGRGPARHRHARPRRRQHRPELRRQVQGGRPRRDPAARPARSASRPSWATTPRCASTAARERGLAPSPDDGHTLIWHAPEGS